MNERTAAADLVRMAEPGDILLAALMRSCGPERARALALSTGRSERQEAADIIARALAETPAEAEAMRARAHAAHQRWRMREDSLDGTRDLRVMERMGARLLLPGDPEWPAAIDDLGTQAPMALWVRGAAHLADALERSAAVVGARAADSYGLTVTRQLAWDVAAHGVTLVSGGAYGVDAAAHRTALAAGAPTVAFMAGGADIAYPRGNAELLGAVAEHGAIVSEAAPGQTAMRHRFLLRNRLIAAASAATVVTAAGHRSGALHTAHRAAELVRPVGAVPGSVLSDQSAGCHRLIQEGAAVMVTSAEDVLALAGCMEEALEEAREEEQGELRTTDEMTPAQLQAYSALPMRRGINVPTLAARAGLSTPQAMSALTALEIAGHSRRTDHGWCKSSGR